MAFKAWSSFREERDPIKVAAVEDGPEYVLPELSADIASQYELLMENLKADVPMAKWKRREERDNVLGKELHARMVADRVPDAFIERCVGVVTLDYQYGREIAEQFYERGLDPKELATLIAARMRALTSTGEVEETPKPASTSGTSSRKPRKRAAASSGPKSSNSGH